MTHRTLHSPSSNTTVTYSWSEGGGFDAVGWAADTRRQLIDDLHDPRSLFAAAAWIVEVADLGTVEDVGDVLGRLYVGETLEEIGSGPPGEIARLIIELKGLRR